MPTYSNAVAQTSQATTVSSNNLVISYANIALISTIPHKYQIEVERIFTTDRNGSSSNVTAFLSDAGVSIEAKRNVFIIPETHPSSGIALWTIDETNKTITINNTNLATYTFTNASPAYSVPVPNIVNGQVVTIRRKTISNTPLVTWTAGNQLTSNQLNLETTQLLYLLQEVLDRVFRQVSIGGDIVSQIADNAITTSKIVDLNVTTPKLAELAVTTGKINNLAVTTAKLDNLSVTNDKIANSTIMAGKLSSSSQEWTLVGTLALTDLATSATGDKVTNKNYVIDRVSKLGVITKDSSNITTTQPLIGTTATSEANDDVSLQSGGLWFNPRDGGLRVRVLDKWVRVTGTPLTINDYISTNSTEQTKTGILNLHNPSAADSLLRITNGSTGAGYGQGFAVGLDGAGNSYLWNEENKNTLFGTNGLERMRIDSTGNVGIGTTTPSSAASLHCHKAGSVSHGIQITNGNTGTTSTDGLLLHIGTAGDAYLWQREAQPLAFATNNTEHMRIDSSGKVGIGTSSPSEKLEVNGNTVLNGTITGSTVGALASSLLPSGCILQVVHVETTTQTDITSITFGNNQLINGLTANITPKRSNSKILVIPNISWYLRRNYGAQQVAVNINKQVSGSSASTIKTYPYNPYIGILAPSTGDLEWIGTQINIYSDTVSSINQHTYRIYAYATYANGDGNTRCSASYNGATSTLTLIEIAV